jgi:SAM-dependent methyltransferase
MRLAASLCFVAIAGCAPAVCPPPSPPAAAAPAPAAAPVPPPTEAAIIENSHAVLDAFDRGDLAWLRDRYAPGFVRFEGQKISPLAQELERLAKRGPHAPSMTRSWSEDHAYVRGNDAVFIGMAIERETGNDSHGNRAFNGWYTMSWTRDRDRWKIAHWTWQRHRTEIEAERDSWNDAYRQSVGFNHQPNRLLVETVRGRKPGRALDVMMGQGRNAVYLATQGWKVTGVDISNEGMRLAREAAAAQHVSIDTVDADIDHYDFGTSRWDLVTMIYAGESMEMIGKIKPSLRPGGLFVVEYFLAGPTSCCGGFERGQPAPLFAGDPAWEILRDEVVEDAPDWATDKAQLVRFVARKK